MQAMPGPFRKMPPAPALTPGPGRAMQDYAQAEEYGFDAGELEESRGRLRSMVDYYGWQTREEGDMEQIHACCDQLMELALSEDEETSESALEALFNMLVDYEEPKSYVTNSYVEAIDRPIVDFVKAHPELQEKENAVLILYCGSVALDDFESAAVYYREVAAHSYATQHKHDTYVFREDGFTRSSDAPNGDHFEEEYDIYSRTLVTYSHLKTGDNRLTYEYGPGSRLAISSRIDTHFGNEPESNDRTFEYEDGRLVREHVFNQTKEPHEYDYIYSYSGQDVVQRFEDPSDPSRSQDRNYRIDYYGHLTETGS